jgi:hypothetical protein
LGFRYFAKDKTGEHLKARWNEGIKLDELKILQHTAYKSMTGGGIEVADKDRVESLIIKGMLSKENKDGISIKSSINYL